MATCTKKTLNQEQASYRYDGNNAKPSLSN